MLLCPYTSTRPNFAGVRRRPRQTSLPRQGSSADAQTSLPRQGSSADAPSIRSGYKKSRTCFTADPAYLNKNKHKISSGKRGLSSLCIVYAL